MKIIITLLVFVLNLLPFLCTGDETKQDDKWKAPSTIEIEKQAYEEGKKEAEKDFKSEKYQLKIYGMYTTEGDPDGHPISKAYAKFLKTKYNVSTKVVAGCCVFPETVGNVKGYNETMKTLLIAKYKTDIFLEAEIHETLEIIENTREKKFTDEEREVAIKKIREVKEKEASNKKDASNPSSPDR
jgi:hypothetical protein